MVQGSSEAVGKGQCQGGSPWWEWGAGHSEVVKERLVLVSCAGRATWLCISEVTARLQGQLNH